MNLQTRSDRYAPRASHCELADRRLRPSHRANHDARWRAVAAVLATLREKGRHAVRIVDADCGAGRFLIDILHHAGELGFKAIEGRGIDSSPTLIARARAAAMRLDDSAIGVEFDAADMVAALRAEQDFPADIVLWRGSPRSPARPEVLRALHAAGDVVIACGSDAVRGRLAA